MFKMFCRPKKQIWLAKNGFPSLWIVCFSPWYQGYFTPYRSSTFIIYIMYIIKINSHLYIYISYPQNLMLKSPMKNHMCHHQRSQVSSQVSRGPRGPRCWMYSWLPTTYVLETWRKWRPLKWHTYVGWVYKPQWCEFVGLDSPQGSQRAAREIYGKSMELWENGFWTNRKYNPHFHFTFVREISTINHSIRPLFLGQAWKWPVVVI